MKGTKITEELSRLVGHSKGLFTRVGSNLRKNGIIPKNADFEAGDTSALFTASIGSYQPRNAVKVVGAYKKCANDVGRSFFETLDELFSKPEAAEKVKALTICQTIPEATLLWDDGTKEVFKFEGEVENPLMRIDATVNGAVIHEISLRFNAKKESNGILMGDAVDAMVKQIKSQTPRD